MCPPVPSESGPTKEEGGDKLLVVAQELPFSSQIRHVYHGLSLSLLGQSESFVSFF